MTMMNEFKKSKNEIELAQNLAGNDEIERKRTLRKLEQFITDKDGKNTGFRDVDVVVLWKGLFYSMWMQDKPIKQEILADDIGNLITFFKNNVESFMRNCYRTINREWMGIDKWRINKYLMLLRRVLRHSLFWVRAEGYSPEAIELFCKVITEEVFDPDDVNLSIKLHITDVYIDELSHVIGEELCADKVTQFILLFIEILKHSKDHVIQKTIRYNVFEHMIRISDVGREKQIDQQRKQIQLGDEDSSEYESDDETIVKDKLRNSHYRKLENRKVMEAMATSEINFDFEDISNRLFIAGKEETTAKKNRTVIYKLVTIFQEAAKNKFPLDKVYKLKTKGITKDIQDRALQRLMEERFSSGEEIDEEEMLVLPKTANKSQKRKRRKPIKRKSNKMLKIDTGKRNQQQKRRK